MNIKRNESDIRTWKEHIFLDISSTNIGSLVPSLYECVETRSIEVFYCHNWSVIICDFRTSLTEFLDTVLTALRDKQFQP
jgi:hypothetical protein